MTLFAKVVLPAGALLAAALSFVTAAPVPAGAKDGDPLPVDTTWNGKLSQRGGGPDGFECVFTITKREGEKFEAKLYEKNDKIGLELTYLVRGTIEPVDPKDKEKGYKLEFKSHEAKDVKNTSEILGVTYTGKVDGKKIKGSWKPPADSPFNDIEGDFEFDLKQKDKEKEGDKKE
jgi:hypothetical protein